MLAVTPAVPHTRRIGVVLFAVTAARWAYLFFLRAQMTGMAGAGAMDSMSTMDTMSAARSAFAMPMTSAWTGQDVVLMWTMWAVMMAAMMIPSALPMVQAYATSVGSGAARSRTGVDGSTPLFVAGYLAAWSGFAAVATVGQWGLHHATLVDAMGASTSRWLAGGVLVAAGVYQFTPLKEACLGRSRTPLGFLLSEWRAGSRGALVMGIHHGTLCIGCCWALMALLFVLGVMNLWWIALVATVVLIEKVTRRDAIPRLVGSGLLVWGSLIVAGVIQLGPS